MGSTDTTGVFHVYDNGRRCIVAPCYQYTVRSLDGTEHLASGLDVSALEPAARDRAREELYDGRWLARGTIATGGEPQPRTGRDFRVTELVERIDTAAARLLRQRLEHGDHLSDQLKALTMTAEAIAHRAASRSESEQARARQLRAEVAHAANRQVTAADVDALAALFGKVLPLAVESHAGAEPIAATWLTKP
ncbi:MAG TPA: hypothetical protein VEK80_03145 [Kribbellaceae bacterium]|nr:hypothetical protein [Kribbellaceae bacterium]